MLTISPAANLEDGDYNITVPAAAVESLQAVPLAADYSFSFTTSPPVQYTLTVIKVGNGMVTPDVGDHLFDEGNGSPPGRKPATGWAFTGWSGDVDAGGSAVTMDGNKSPLPLWRMPLPTLLPPALGPAARYSLRVMSKINDGASR